MSFLMRCARHVARAGLVLVASLWFAVSIGEARDARRGHGGGIIGELPPMTRQGFDEIVVEMAPLKPIRKAAAAATAKSVKPSAVALEKPKETPKETQPLAAVAKAPAAPVEAKTPATAAAPPIETAKAAQPGGMVQSPPPPAAPAPTAHKVSPEADALNASPAVMAAPVAETRLAAPVVEAPAPAPVVEAPAVAQAPEPVVEAAKPAPEEAPLAAPPVEPAPPQISDDWARLREAGVSGPTQVRIADRATLWLPAGRFFVPAEKLRELAAAKGQSWNEANLGAVFGETRGVRWNADIATLDDGHINDGDAKTLDPAKALDAYKAGLAPRSAENAGEGVGAAQITDWVEAPRYDEKHRLSYCVGAAMQASPERLVNCSSYALGRQGAIRISLATTAEDFASVANEAAALADAIAYDRGKAYEDADAAADNMAGYGVAELAARLGPSAPLILWSAPGQTSKEVVTPWSMLAAIGDYWLYCVAMIAGVALFTLKFRSKKAPAANPPQADAPARDRPAEDAKPSALARLAAGTKAKIASRRGESEAAALGAASTPPAEKTMAETAPANGSFGKLRSAMAGFRFMRKAQEPTPAADRDAMAGAETQVSATQVSALTKLAARMKKSAPQPQAVSAPSAARMAAAAAPAPASEPAGAAAIDDIGLVEPGDSVAASAAISARRRLRDAHA